MSLLGRPGFARRRRAVGIALGGGSAIAALDGPSAASLVARQGLPDWAAGLESLLQDKQVVDAARRHGVRIALLPPLVEDRLFRLAGLTAVQAERALTFRAARHFSRTVEMPVISAAKPTGSGDLFLASMASGVEIARIHSVLASAGVCCIGVHSACAAWLERWSKDAPRVLIDGEVLYAAVRARGQLTSLRRVPLSSPACTRVLAEAGLPSVQLHTEQLPDAAAFAACLMLAPGTRELLTPRIRGDRRRRAQRRTGTMLAAAAAMVILAQSVGYIIQGRELAQLRRMRLETAEAAHAALSQRNRLDALTAAVAELAEAEQAVSVPELLAQLLPHLPAGTTLEMLEIGSDELVLAGEAPAADRVFTHLVAAQGVGRVEWIGPVRRSVEGANGEVFGLTATLRHDP